MVFALGNGGRSERRCSHWKTVFALDNGAPSGQRHGSKATIHRAKHPLLNTPARAALSKRRRPSRWRCCEGVRLCGEVLC
eukprot:355847-Chlamydomonas_euryale.AAC.4